MIKSFFQSSLILLFLFLWISGFPQKQDRIWLFADSAGIDFNDIAHPVAITSNITYPCLTSFTSIADNNGNLLFYSAGTDLFYYSMHVFDKYGNQMQGSDSLRGYPWVRQGSMIIPMPGNTNKYYLFLGDRMGSMGNYIFYNVIDMSLNGGLGSVISRNNLLLNDYVNEKLNAVKHANGRDWWIIVQSTNVDSLFHKFLVTPDTILGPFDQKIGSGDNINKAHGQMIFNRDGSKLGLVGSNSTVDFFNFDRCTGDLFNYQGAGEGVISLQNFYFGCSFSSDGNVFYTSSIWHEYKNIYQYDLTANDIKASKQTIFSYQDTGVYNGLSMGMHLLGPDDRIYIIKGDGFTHPNSDTYYTHHIDVILNPNQLGMGCNYQSSYLDLGNGRTIQGLPTMLNYNLGPVTGSICDSLSIGINEIQNDPDFQIYPNPFNEYIIIHSLFELTGSIMVENEFGAAILNAELKTNKKINTGGLSSGIYLLRIHSNKGSYFRKIIKVY